LIPTNTCSKLAADGDTWLQRSREDSPMKIPIHVAPAVTALALLALTFATASPAAAQTPQPLGDEIIVHEADRTLIAEPAVAVADSGRFLVVWQEALILGAPLNSRVLGRVFEADGTAVSDSFTIDPAPPRADTMPAVAAQPGGRFVVVWKRHSPDTHDELRGQILQPDGSPAGDGFQVGTASYGYPKQPAVAASQASGDFVVTWSSYGGGYGYIEAQRFTAEGARRGGTLRVAAVPGTEPDVVVADGGDFIIAWRSPISLFSESEIVARRYSDDGLLLVEQTTLAPETKGGAGLALAGNDVVAVWPGADGTPQARRFRQSDLQPSGPPQVLAPAANTGQFALTGAGDGLFASWIQPQMPLGGLGAFDVGGRGISLTGQPTGEPVTIPVGPHEGGLFSHASGNGAGRVVVSYTADKASGANTIADVRAHRFQAAVTCQPSNHRLCLQNDRFAVEARWKTRQGAAGFGAPVALSDESGYFTFFNPDNVELLVKVLDACAPPFERYWVFAAGLTNVEVDLTVIDTATGEAVAYRNPLSTPFQPILDTQAFATCP
jgi:hypothetical protein